MFASSSTLNFGFAASEAARFAGMERSGAESVAEQLKQASGSAGLVAGTTVTARYRYKVAADGSFIPLQTQITTEEVADDLALQGEGRGNRRARENAQERQPNFRDYAPLKPQLSPADEAELFSTRLSAVPGFGFSGYAPKVRVSLNTHITAAEVRDEAGDFVQAEVIAPQTERTTQEERVNYSASFRRAQYAVASLYARSGTVVNAPASEVHIAA